MVLTQDDHGEYFWLNGSSLQGQADEQETAQVNQRASLKSFSEALQENQAGPVQPGQIHGRPVRGRS
jgi:hypothetical protein